MKQEILKLSQNIDFFLRKLLIFINWILAYLGERADNQRRLRTTDGKHLALRHWAGGVNVPAWNVQSH